MPPRRAKKKNCKIKWINECLKFTSSTKASLVEGNKNVLEQFSFCSYIPKWAGKEKTNQLYQIKKSKFL